MLHLAGLKDLKTISQQTPISELGMDSMMAVEIKQTLEREFEIFLTAQDIRGLNFAKLMEMDKKGDDPSEAKAARDDEENEMDNIRLVLQISGSGNVNLDACIKLQSKEEAGRTPVFLLPGIEGAVNVFTGLAKKLKSQVYGLQAQICNVDTPTVESMAESLVPVSDRVFDVRRERGVTRVTL